MDGGYAQFKGSLCRSPKESLEQNDRGGVIRVIPSILQIMVQTYALGIVADTGLAAKACAV